MKNRQKPKAIKKRASREVIMAKKATAAEAVGKIEKNTDTFILTYGQFSLIDALCAILDQIGPADVTIATWTAADAHLERSAALLESSQIKSMRFIVDGSFLTRQPDYCHHMIVLFGEGCIRAIKTHAKFLLIRSDTHDVVVRTSMNLNENPRLENLEVSEDIRLAEFFQEVADSIFCEMEQGSFKQLMPGFAELQESCKFKQIRAGVIKRENLNAPKYTHTV